MYTILIFPAFPLAPFSNITFIYLFSSGACVEISGQRGEVNILLVLVGSFRANASFQALGQAPLHTETSWQPLFRNFFFLKTYEHVIFMNSY